MPLLGTTNHSQVTETLDLPMFSLTSDTKMGYQWLGRMPYLSKTRHGIYRYRRTIPPALREATGRREFVKSLQTRDPQEAKKLWAVINLEFEQHLSLIRLEALSSLATVITVVVMQPQQHS